MENKTIIALSTPLGVGAISIIKMSGNNALNIAKQLFVGADFDNIIPRKMYFGRFALDNGFVEECLMVYFKAPFSYTGEDVVEFQCHGSEYLCGKIIDECRKKGAVLAQPGEFTKLAFLNGKVSLEKAEGIIDVINSQSEAELKAAKNLTNGELFKKITTLQDKLLDLLASIEVGLDYPEHDDEAEGKKSSKIEIKNIKDAIQKVLDNSQNSSLITSGVNVAISGKPNVGKSSLLNALLKNERAIVTNIPGTTRDTIKETFVYNGIKINLIDTAGIRETDDVVEKIGVQKSYTEIENADITLYMLSFEDCTKSDIEKIKEIKCKNVIVVLNKCDADENKKSKVREQLKNIKEKVIEISAKENINLEKLLQAILETTKVANIDYSQIILTNKRHIEACEQSITLCEQIENLSDFEGLDIYAMLVKNLYQTLGKITGKTENEELIDKIFSKFCLGK